jgi:hypothetical protein
MTKVKFSEYIIEEKKNIDLEIKYVNLFNRKNYFTKNFVYN